MSDEDRDKEFDYLRGQSPEQQEAADEVEPRIEDDTRSVGSGEDADGERARGAQAGL